MRQWTWLNKIMHTEKWLYKATGSSEKWKREFNSERRSSTYDKTIDIFALRRAERLLVLETLLPEIYDSQFQILELGSGTGIVTEFLVKHYPKANFTAVEGAERMVGQARSKSLLQRHEHRIEWILADYSSPVWLEGVKGPFHLVVSVDALHHLTHDRKRSLYREIYDAMIPGGCFLISDHISSREPYYKDLQYSLWIKDILSRLKQVEKNSEVAAMLEKTYKGLENVSLETVQKKFTKGLQREGENPMPLMEHVDVMRRVGFDDVTVEYRYSNFAVISARKGDME